LTVRFRYERLDNVTTVDYSNNSSLTTTTSYTYSGYQVASKKVTTSDGNSMTEEYYYPKDYAQAPSGQQSIIKAMRDKNILEPAFKTTQKLNGNTQYVRSEYALFHNSFYKPSKVYSWKGSGDEALRGSYEYDTAANLCGITRGTLQKTAVAWGYGSTLPVAVVEGMNYASLTSLAGSTVMNGLNGSTAAAVSSALSSLRTKAGTGGLVTTYTYQPLVGMLARTEPNGNVTEYVYDNAWKLYRQKDKDGKVVEQYAYSPLNGSGITLPETETDVPVVVQFTGISQSGSTASAQIVCTGDCQVTFYLMGEANEGMAEYMLDGHYYSYTGTFGDYVTLNLTEGSHSFSASVSGSGSASLYINAVDAPNTLGSNLSIQANN
jgi:YD repeat-containing protein